MSTDNRTNENGGVELIYKFEIKQRLPSFNDYIKACRTNKFAGAKMKEKIEYDIWIYILQQLQGVRIRKPVFVRFTWVEENGKRDLDNICFAKKFILDALQKADVIENDDRKHVTGFMDYFEYADESKVIVELEEITNEQQK